MQFLAFVLSITLHVGLVAGMFLWPAGSTVKPSEAPVFISLVEGDFGGTNAPSVILGAAGKPAEKIAPSLPSEQTAPPPVPVKEEVLQIPKEIKTAEPEKKVEQNLPEPKPLPKPEPKEKPKVETPKPAPKKPEPKQEAKKPAPKKTETKKPAPKKESTTAKKPAKKPAKLTPEQEIKRAMAEAKKNAGGFGGGGGGQGDGPGGGGSSDENAIYIAQVMMAVQSNWEFESATRNDYVSYVLVSVDARGNVISAKLDTSSGNAQFDASTVNAVLRTGINKEFPAPPDTAHQKLRLKFDPNMMR